ERVAPVVLEPEVPRQVEGDSERGDLLERHRQEPERGPAREPWLDRAPRLPVPHRRGARSPPRGPGPCQPQGVNLAPGACVSRDRGGTGRWTIASPAPTAPRTSAPRRCAAPTAGAAWAASIRPAGIATNPTAAWPASRPPSPTGSASPSRRSGWAPSR